MLDKKIIKARYEAGYYSDFNPTPPHAKSADAELYGAGQQLRDWARYLAKNSAIIKATLDARQAKGVGPGLTYEPMVRDRRGDLLPKLNSAIKRAHDDWSEKAGVTGEHSREELERLAWRDWDTAGEVFARSVYRPRSPARPSHQIQLIKSELVPYGFLDEGRTRLGIERDEFGVPLKYWLYPRHPTGDLWYQSANQDYEPKSVPAQYIRHLRRQEELDATRGVTLFHAVIFRASDIAEYQQSHRRAARASANLFMSINREFGIEDTSENPTTTPDLNLIDPVILDWLKPGESLNFHSPAHPNQNAPEFVNQELRQFAAACRVAFSWIAYVFDKAYAAQRTELVHAWEMIYEDRAQFIRDFARPMLYREPLRIALLERVLPAVELRKADPATLFDVRIEGPTMPQIDPVKDKQAAQLDQENGWESRHGIIRKFGRNPAQVDGERDADDFEPVTAAATANQRQEIDSDDESDDSTDGD